MPEAPTQGHHVTVGQLLNHTSGIYSFTSLPNAADNERLELTHEQVLALIKDLTSITAAESSLVHANRLQRQGLTPAQIADLLSRDEAIKTRVVADV